MSTSLSEEEIARMFADNLEKEPSVVRVKFRPLEPVGVNKVSPRPIETLNDVKLSIKVQLGVAELSVRDVLELEEGSTIELDRVAGEPVDVLINDQPFATGEIVVINEVFGVRISGLDSEELERGE